MRLFFLLLVSPFECSTFSFVDKNQGNVFKLNKVIGFDFEIDWNKKHKYWKYSKTNFIE